MAPCQDPDSPVFRKEKSRNSKPLSLSNQGPNEGTDVIGTVGAFVAFPQCTDCMFRPHALLGLHQPWGAPALPGRWETSAVLFPAVGLD